MRELGAREARTVVAPTAGHRSGDEAGLTASQQQGTKSASADLWRFPEAEGLSGQCADHSGEDHVDDGDQRWCPSQHAADGVAVARSICLQDGGVSS